MQQTGTLRKRKKRNLAKVGGLGTAIYNDFEDTYDGQDMYGGYTDNKHVLYETGSDTRIRMQALTSGNTDGHHYHYNAMRVTRNPAFHDADGSPYPDPEWGSPASPSDCSSYMGSPPRTGDLGERGPPARTHFLDKSAMSRLKEILILGGFAGAFPWYWDKREFQVNKWSPTFEMMWKAQRLFFSIQFGFITMFQFYSFYTRVAGGHHDSFRGVFMSCFSVYWYICAVYFNVNMYFYKEQIRQYINTLLKFNKEYVDKYLIHLDGYKDGGRVLIRLSIPCNMSQVFASVALFLVMPYQPWYLFSFIYPKPWYWLIPGAMQEFIMAGQVITSFILTSWIVAAHTNSVEFWLWESHNHYDSDYTRDELRHPKTALETYRALQVLCTSFNDCMSPLAIPLVKIHMITGIVPCGYVLIRSMNKIFIEEFPGIMTYPIGVIDCATSGFAIMALSAQMFDIANSFVDSWSQTKQRNFRRILMSFPTLKVKVARFYFITVATTITFFKTIFELITDCIITFP